MISLQSRKITKFIALENMKLYGKYNDYEWTFWNPNTGNAPLGMLVPASYCEPGRPFLSYSLTYMYACTLSSYKVHLYLEVNHQLCNRYGHCPFRHPVLSLFFFSFSSHTFIPVFVRILFFPVPLYWCILFLVLLFSVCPVSSPFPHHTVYFRTVFFMRLWIKLIARRCKR